MHTRSLTRWVALLVASGLLASSAQAQTVLDFNELPTSPSGGVSVRSPLIEDGFRLTRNTGVGFLAMQDGWQNNRGSSNGTTTLYTYVNFGPSTSFTLDSVSGEPFALTSIDVSELFNVGDFAHDAGLVTVDVIADMNPSGIVVSSFEVDGISDGIGGANDFQTFEFQEGFTSVFSVRFIASSDDIHTYFNFDNITLNGNFSGCDDDMTPPEVIAGEDIVVFVGEEVFLPAPIVTDLCDPNPIQFDDAPDVFAQGETLVTFSAQDASGNLGEDAVLVTVLGAQEAIGTVVELIGTEHHHLLAVLETVTGSLDREKPDTAVNQLGAFRNQLMAQTGKTISPDEANEVLSLIDRIEASIVDY